MPTNLQPETPNEAPKPLLGTQTLNPKPYHTFTPADTKRPKLRPKAVKQELPANGVDYTRALRGRGLNHNNLRGREGRLAQIAE